MIEEDRTYQRARTREQKSQRLDGRAPSLPKSLCEASIAARVSEAASRPVMEDASKEPKSLRDFLAVQLVGYKVLKEKRDDS